MRTDHIVANWGEPERAPHSQAYAPSALSACTLLYLPVLGPREPSGVVCLAYIYNCRVHCTVLQCVGGYTLGMRDIAAVYFQLPACRATLRPS